MLNNGCGLSAVRVFNNLSKSVTVSGYNILAIRSQPALKKARYYYQFVAFCLNRIKCYLCLNSKRFNSFFCKVNIILTYIITYKFSV